MSKADKSEGDDAARPRSRKAKLAPVARDIDGRTSGTRSIVLVPLPPRGKRFERQDPTEQDKPPTPPLHSPDDRLAEAMGLADAIALDVVKGLIVPLPAPRPSTLFGKGKVDEIKAMVEAEEISLVIVDHALSPIQQRNLEKAWGAKVLDRTGLILEIFGRRAQTREGRLQVELAHLTYQKSRLVRSWTHLERQRGGAGFLGGPGESQLELDRRLIQDRIDGLKKEIAAVVRTRDLNRAGRRKVPYKVVAIVGYTNAGKSTLFNRITGAGVHAEDQVFATLDPTMREVRVAPGRKIILSDTVGFISDLPTMLVAAFRATLEEVIEAELILHVRDISHPETEAQAADVNEVLRGLGIDPRLADSNIVEVWNKIDRLAPEQRAELHLAAARAETPPALVSAVSGDGVAELLAAIDTRLGLADELVTVTLAPGQGRLMAWLHGNAEVVRRETGEDGQTTFTLRIAAEKRARLEHRMKADGRDEREGP